MTVATQALANTCGVQASAAFPTTQGKNNNPSGAESGERLRLKRLLANKELATRRMQGLEVDILSDCKFR